MGGLVVLKTPCHGGAASSGPCGAGKLTVSKSDLLGSLLKKTVIIPEIVFLKRKLGGMY